MQMKSGTSRSVSISLSRRVHHILTQITHTAQSAGWRSAGLSTTSQPITVNSEETAAQADDVVSKAAQAISQNLQTVATGAEEMSASIRGDPAKNAAEAAKVAKLGSQDRRNYDRNRIQTRRFFS